MDNQNQNTSAQISSGDGASLSQPVVEVPNAASLTSLDAGALAAEPNALATPEPLDVQAPAQPSWWRRLLRRADLAILVLLVLMAAGLLITNLGRGKQPVKQANVATQYSTQQIPLNGFVATAQGINLTASSVVINGPLKLNQGVVVTPSVQPNSPTAGQLYYDQNTNQLAYFNGTSFVPLSANGAVVQTLGGASGQITLGGGLSVLGNQLTVSFPAAAANVSSLGGQTGAITLGSGLNITGNTLQNSGVLNILAGTSIAVTNDGNGNYTISNTGSGTGTVASSGGTAGTIALFTASQNIENSNITQSGGTVTITGNLNVSGALGLGSALTVANGGTGATSLAANGVIVGSGTSALSSVTAAGSGLCFLSTAGAPTFAACPSASGVTSLDGLTGALTLANSSGVGSTVTIDNASTAAKGIASFNATNFSVASGAVNTIQDINTTATPTFTGVNTNSITPSAALTVGATNQNLTLQGNASFSFTSTAGANTTTVNFQSPTASVTYRFATAAAGSYDICTTVGNCVGTGGGVTTPGGTTGALAKFTGSQTIGDSLLSESGSTVTAAGNFNLTSGNQYRINGSQISSANLSNDSNLAKLNATQTFTGATNTFQNSSNSATAFSIQNTSGNRLLTANTSAGQIEIGQSSVIDGLLVFKTAANGNAGTLKIATLGQDTTYTLPDPGVASATICLSTGNCSGASVTLQSAYNNSTSPEITLDSTRGALTIRDNATPLGANLLEVQNNAGGTTYFAVSATGTSVTGTSTASGNINSSGGALQTNGTTRVDNSGNLSNIGTISASGNITTAANATLQGGNVTVGTTSQAGTLTLSDGSSNTGTLQTAALGGDRTYTFPDATGTVCLSTGNCAGAGVTLQTAYDNSTSPEIVLDGTRGALTVRDNATPLGANLLEVQNNAGSTTYFAVTASGASVTGTTTSSGSINSSGGSLQTNGTTRIDNSGNASNIGNISLSGSISGGTTYTGSGNINTSGGVIQTNGTTRLDNSGNLSNIGTISASGNITTAGTATLQGGSLTLGTTSQLGTLIFNDGSSNTGTLQVASLGQDTVYTLPDPGTGTVSICLTTGNCAGSGGGVTGTGTNNRLAKFTSTGSTIGDSTITDNGTTVTTSVNLVIQGGSATVGTTSQAGSLLLSDGSSNTGNLQTAALASDRTYTFPDASGTVCLSTGNCSGSGSSNTLQAAYDAGNTITTTDTRDIAITLANSVTTDSNLTVTTAAGSTSFTSFALADGSNASPAAQLVLVKNNDTNQVLAAGISVQSAAGGITTAFDASGSNITNALSIGANAISGTNFSVTGGGAVTAVGVNSGTGLLQGTGGLTVTGTVSINNNTNSNTSINTGTSTGTVTIGGGSAPLVIDSTNFDVSSAGALSGITTISTSSTINSQTISSTANFTGTVTIQGSNALTLGVTGSATGAVLFKGATAASGTITFIGPSNPSNNTITLPNETGTVCTTGSICSGYQAAGNYLVQVPAATGTNTVTPTAASVVGLTVNGTNGTSAVAAIFNQANSTSTADTVQINSTNTGATQTNGLLFNRNGTGGTTTNGVNVTNTLGTTTNGVSINQSGGTLTNGLSFSGTIGTDINRASGSLSVVGNGGISLQTGGSSTINIGTTNANTINIGTGANANTVHIADAVGTAQNVFLGSNGGSSATTTILGGSSGGGGGINVGTSGATTVTIGNTGSASNSVDISSGSSGSITVGASLGTQTVTVGSLGASAVTNLRGGSTGGINIGVVGSATDSSTIHISDTSSTTGTQVLTIGSIAANSGNNTTIQGGSGAGAVSVQAAASGTISIGTSNNNTIAIGSTGNTAGIVLGQSTASNTINVGNGTTAAGNTQTVNIATSATSTGKAVVTVGNTNGTSSLTLQGGTAGVSLLSAANVTIGTSDTTGTLLVLDTKTSSGDPTGVNGGLYYNSNSNKFRCYENSAWTNCIASGSAITLQNAYDNSTGGTTPEIKLDSTRNGIEIQDADTTLGGSQNFLSMRAPNAGGLGNIVFGFGIQGNIAFTPTADSTSLWDINNSSGNNLLTLDSTNGRLGINLGSTTLPTDTLTVNGRTNITGPTSGAALLVTNSSSTGSVATFSDNAISVLDIQDGGHFVFKSVVDNDNAVRFTNQTNNNIFSIDTANGRLGLNLGGANNPTLDGSSKGIEMQGALRLSGGSGSSNNLTDLYTTPLGSTIRTKINIANYDPSANGVASGAQVLALGISNCTDTTDLTTNCSGGLGVTNATARGITVLDARKGTTNASHQPSIGVISPDENQIFGFSWEGSNTIGYVKSIGTTIGIRVNTTDIATFSSTAVNLNMDTTIASGKNLTVTSGATSLTGASGGSSTAATVATGAASNVGLKIQGASSQTADLLQLQDSTSSNIFRVDAAGNLESIGYFSNGFGGLGNFGNLLTYSEQFDNAAWTKTNVTAPTADTIVAPDSQTSAESLATSASGGSVSQTSGTAPTNNNYTFSVWLKTASGTQNVDLRIDGATSGTGTVKTVTARTTWQRFFVTQNTNGFTGNIKPLIFPGGTGGSGTVHAWGAQLILSSQPEVYVRATTSTVAANRGIVSNGGAFISSINSGDIPLVVQGAPGQSGDLLQLQNASGTVLANITSAGALAVSGLNTGSGLLQGTGGLTLTGAVSINNNANNNTSFNTGTSTGTITLGGGSAPLVINSTNFDVSSAGAVSGITDYAQASGNFLQSGTGTFGTGSGNVSLNGSTTVASTKTFTVTSGATSLTGASTGDALTVSNDSSTGNIAVFKDNSTAVATLADGGAATFENSTNSTAAFRIQNASASTFFNADSTNKIITTTDMNVGSSAGSRLFSDSLEGNSFGLWDLGATNGGGGATATIDSTIKRNGNYSAKFVSGSGNNYYRANVKSTTGNIYMRGYVYVSSHATADVNFFDVISGDGTTFSVGRKLSNGNMIVWDGTAGGVTHDTGVAFSTGTWHKVELRSGTASGSAVQGYLDGVLVGNYVSGGAVAAFNKILMGDDGGASTSTVYMDDISVDATPTSTTDGGGLNVQDSFHVSGSSTLGQTWVQPGSDSTAAFQVLNSSGTAFFSVDTTNSAVKLLTSGGILDMASGTAGNTATLKIPTRTSSACTSGTSEGLVFRDTGGTQRGHMCIDGGTPLLKFFASAFSASSTDVAENYSDIHNNLQPGDLVALDDSGTPRAITKATQANASRLFGVISTAPGMLLSGIDDSDGSTNLVNPKPVALSGRIPTKVSTENGAIAPGDFLTISSTPGVAAKASGAGMVIGRALEAYSSNGTGTIEVVAQNGYYPGLSSSDNLQNGHFSDLLVDGTLTTNNLTVTGTATVKDLVVTNSATIQTLQVIGTATIGDLAVQHTTTTVDLKVTGTAEIQQLQIGDRLTLGAATEDPTADIAHPITKRFKASKPITAGAVVIADTTPGWATTTTTNGDKRVIGVAVNDAVHAGDVIEVAIAGTAKVKLHGVVSIGDLVQVDSVEGKASAVASPAPGAVVGKVLGTVDADGQALVLVTLE